MITGVVNRRSKSKFIRTKLSVVAGILSVLVGTLLLGSPAHAVTPPSFTISPKIQITAKGGYLSDPETGRQIFYKDGSTWKYSANDRQWSDGYYNASKQEVYFKYNTGLRLYVTQVTQFLNLNGTFDGTNLCFVAISVNASNEASFSGVDAKSGKATSGCKEAVKDQVGPLEVSFATPNISGEQFMGVTIETCKPQPEAVRYNNCLKSRAQHITQANNAIQCTTSSAQSIKECESNKAIIACLKESPTNKVSYCQSREDARKILDGDLSEITGDMTDKEIEDLCNTLKTADNKKECIEAATKQRDSLKPEGAEDKNTTTCAIDGVGWIICPITKIISKFNDSLFAILEGLMGVSPTMFDPNGPTYKSWSSMRNIANVAFIVAFMVIIYSQITSAGISNYGIKRLLPRIVIAAILVNISFWICAAAVDISNIAGSSLHSLMTEQVKSIGSGVGANLHGNWDSISTFLLAGGTGAVAAGGAALTIGAYGFLGALALFIPLAVTALIAVLTVVFVLVARQAFIIILVVLSPLAFVAYLLPNTESWFDKWRKFFMSLLLIYPMVALLFGGTQLASAIIRNGADDALVMILSLAVLVIPLFITPLLLKFSGGLISRVAGMMNNKEKGPLDRLKKAGEGYANRQRGFRMGDRIQKTEDLRNGNGRVLGAAGSRRRNAAAWVRGIGNVNGINTDQKNNYADVAAKGAARNYVADRASANPDYANKLAGGDKNLGKFVQAYAIQAKEEEYEKDVKAAYVFEKEAGRTKEDLRKRVNDSTLDIHERSAAMRRFKEVANAQETQNMVEDIASMGGAAIAAKNAIENGTASEADHKTLEASKKIQSEFDQAFSGSPLVPASISGTDKGNMRNGIFATKRDERIKRDLEGDDKGSKVSSDYVLKMDVDEMHEWAKDSSDTLKSLSPEARGRFISAINEAANDDIKGNQFENRQIEQLKKIAGHLGGTVTVTNPKYQEKWQ